MVISATDTGDRASISSVGVPPARESCLTRASLMGGFGTENCSSCGVSAKNFTLRRVLEISFGWGGRPSQ